LGQHEVSSVVEEHLRECAECRALREDLRANKIVLESLRVEELPRVAVRIPRRGSVFPWVAAAAAVVVGMLLAPRPQPMKPVASQVVNEPVQPLKIKMLTPDPDVVIYWLIEN
jgi:hypothetical protein